MIFNCLFLCDGPTSKAQGQRYKKCMLHLFFSDLTKIHQNKNLIKMGPKEISTNTNLTKDNKQKTDFTQ